MMTSDSKNCGWRSLGVLVISQILCLAQADGTKPNGWDNVLDRIKTDLNSNGGAEKPSSVLRGTERELKHSVSQERIWLFVIVSDTRIPFFFVQISDLYLYETIVYLTYYILPKKQNSKRSGSGSKSKSSQPQGGTEDIVAVSQMKLDGMTVEECLAMGDFMSKTCTKCSIMFNKMELTYPEPKGSGGAVFMYNYDAYKKVYDNIEEYQLQFPLTCEDYPISNDETKMTAVMASNAISIRDYRSEDMSHCITDVMHALGINKLPPNPPCRGDDSRRLEDDAMKILEAQADPYWNELAEVLDYQNMRIEYGDTPASVVFPPDFPLPAAWRGYTVNQVAQAVSTIVEVSKKKWKGCFWFVHIAHNALAHVDSLYHANHSKHSFAYAGLRRAPLLSSSASFPSSLCRPVWHVRAGLQSHACNGRLFRIC